MDRQIYIDSSGKRFVLVGETRSGVYAWFRPLMHANDGFYDVSRRMVDMRPEADSATMVTA